MPIEVTPRVIIPDTELAVTFARSGGPGGQNVNKVSSKAVLRWRIVESTALPPDAKQRLLEALGSRITNDGELVISCDETRDQAQNVSIAEGRIASFVKAALVRPKPRHKTKPTRGSVQRRLKAKTVRSETKKNRSVRDDD